MGTAVFFAGLAVALPLLVWVIVGERRARAAQAEHVGPA
jgi:hypothetical protein